MADIIDVNIGDQVLEIFWQDEVELNLDMNLMYIKSGQKEIQDYVDNVSKPEIDNYIETQAKPIVSEVVSQIAEPLVNEYIETETKPSIDEYVNGLKPSLQTYVDQAQTDANSAATSMEQAALSATAASNYASNASADADNAAESAGLAANSAIWAEGTDSEVHAIGGVHSSKGWSEAAQAVVEGKQDIANLSQTLDNSTTKYPSNAAVKAVTDTKAGLADNNTFTGSNTFTKTINKKSSEMDITVTPKIELYSQIDFRDKNGLRMGAVENQQVAGTNIFRTRIQSNREINGVQRYSQVQAVIEPDGKMYGLAPSTPAGSVNNEIATADWVNNKFKVVSTLPANPVDGTFYYIPE